MIKKTRLLLSAEHEMFDAACYYELQAPGLGQDLLDKIKLALQDIVESPERCPIVRGDIRRRLIRRFPYSLLYRIDPDEIVILAVMHQSGIHHIGCQENQKYSVMPDYAERPLTLPDILESPRKRALSLRAAG